jgi:predicted O-methyltransferase YrrM
MPSGEVTVFDPKTSYPESKWTEPRGDCSHPEHWHSTDSESTELEVSELIGGFIRALQPEYVVETGSCVGMTSFVIGTALKMNGHGKLDTCEVNRRAIDWARGLCEGLPVRVHEIQSMNFRPARDIDFLFLDSLMELRVPEFHRFKRWFSPGAVIAFHDTGPHKGDFQKMVHAIEGLRFLQLNTPRGITLAQYDGG